MRLWNLTLAALLSPSLALLSGCNRADARDLRDALAEGDTQRALNVVRAPECAAPDDVECLSFIAKRFGSKEAFNAANPDQAGAAAVALVLVRERRGDVIPGVDTWLAATRSASGAGADAVRLAIATRMSDIAPRLAKPIDDERQALAIARAIGTAFPGVCRTYAKLPDDPSGLSAMRPEEHPDHAPCVQRDLARSTGLGPAYGFGAWRALAGALALWSEELNALEVGASKMSGKPKDALAARLPAIEAATLACRPKRLESPGDGTQGRAGEGRAGAIGGGWNGAMGGAAHAGALPSPSASPSASQAASVVAPASARPR